MGQRGHTGAHRGQSGRLAARPARRAARRLHRDTRPADTAARAPHPPRRRAGCWSVAAPGRARSATRSAAGDESPKARTDSRPTAGGHAVAIQVQRSQVRRDDHLFGVHLHAVDHGQEVFLRAGRSAAPRRRSTRVTGSSASPRYRPAMRSPPGGQPRQAVGQRRLIVGNVIDQAAERIDRVHRVPAVRRQHPHAAIERRAGGAHDRLDRVEIGLRIPSGGVGGIRPGSAARRTAAQPCRACDSATRPATGSCCASRAVRRWDRPQDHRGLQHAAAGRVVRLGRSRAEAVHAAHPVQQGVEDPPQRRCGRWSCADRRPRRRNPPASDRQIAAVQPLEGPRTQSCMWFSSCSDAAQRIGRRMRAMWLSPCRSST